MEVFKRVITAYLPELEDVDFDRLVKAYAAEQEKVRETLAQNPAEPPIDEPKEPQDDDE